MVVGVGPFTLTLDACQDAGQPQDFLNPRYQSTRRYRLDERLAEMHYANKKIISSMGGETSVRAKNELGASFFVSE